MPSESLPRLVLFPKVVGPLKSPPPFRGTKGQWFPHLPPIILAPPVPLSMRIVRPVFSATGLLITVTIIMCLTLLPIGCERRSPSMTALAQVPQRHTVVGYERAEFGAGWGSSTTRPGCSVRDDMLRTQLTVLTESDRCKPIAQGICPYSGRVISSDPAMAAGEPIELDHIFPLSAAWDMGAYAWPMAKRLAFANDPANLVAVAKAENQAKSDSLPSEWLPSDSSRRCWYVNQLADIAVTYGLAVSAADAAVMRHQCPMG